MHVLRLAILAAVSGTVVLPAATVPGDARRGAELFESQKCVVCHSVDGRGGKTAPDLGKRTGRAYTPSLMASLMWNHAPPMWRAMEQAGIPRPALTEEQAADLFAYLYAFRYFEQPGDAARGRQLFLNKRCADCHELAAAGAAGAPPVAKWESLTDSIALARAMWNHAPKMREEMAKRKIPHPQLTSQEITDLVVYLRNIPQARPGEEKFAPAAPETGADLFQAKGCTGCHQGSLKLEERFRGRTMTDLAAGMWNHSPKMLQMPPDLSVAEMRRLVGYLWSIQYFEQPGDARRGARVFESKRCAVCHNDPASGAPSLTGKSVNTITMVSVLWRHGPEMLRRMEEKKIGWPQFRDADMSHLVAYINSLK